MSHYEQALGVFLDTFDDDLVPRDPWTGDDVRERWRDVDREDEPEEPDEDP